MRLSDIIRTPVLTIEPNASLSAARAEMRRHRIRHLVVVDDEHAVGIISDHEVGRVRRRNTSTVGDVMSRDVVSATPDTTVAQAARLIGGHTTGCLLVADGDDLLGLVTTTDVLDQLGKATKRGAFPQSLPRPVKLARDRTGALPPPAHIRVIGARLSATDRAYISEKLGRKLRKFASSIERITVRLTDVNGPKGGRDLVCQIKVVLSGLPSAVVEERDSTFQRAADRAINAMTITLRRTLQRRRSKPQRGRKGARPPGGA